MKLSVFSAAFISVSATLGANAQTPLVHLPFDGNVENLGTASAGALVVPAGADQPQFISGAIGQGISFGKGGAVAIPFHFDQQKYPQATVTMWIKVDKDEPYERELLSLGPGNALLLNITGQETIRVRSGVAASSDSVLPLGEWAFVAGVVDNAAGAVRIYHGEDVFEKTGLKIGSPGALTVAPPGSSEKKNYIFIGADDFNSAGKEIRRVALDDVRLYGEALTASQIDAVRRAGEIRIADAKGRDLTPEASPVGDGKPDGKSGSVIEPPADKRRNLPGAEREETGVELESPRPIERTPDQDLTIPGGTPAEQLEEDLKEIENRTPPVEVATEIVCEPVANGDAALSATSSSFPSDFIAALSKAKSCDLDLTVSTVNQNGQWIVATADQIAHSRNLSAPLLSTLATIEKKHGGLDAADISESGAFLLSVQGVVYDSGLSADAKAKVQRLVGGGGGGLRFFDFHPTDAQQWVAVGKSGTVIAGKPLSSMLKALADLSESKRKVRAVRFGAGNSWVLMGTGSWVVSSGIDRQTLAQLKTFQRGSRRLDHISLTDQAGRYVFYSADKLHPSYSDAINRFEQGFEFTGGTEASPKTVSASIWARMDAHNLKGVSIAYIQNNQIQWVRGYGLMNGDLAESYVLADTTFEAASLSKPIATYGLLKLVEDGKLSLTEEGVFADLEQLMKSGERRRYRDNVRPEKSNLIQLLQHCASICYQYKGQCTAANGGGGGAKEYTTTQTLPDVADMLLGEGSAAATHKLNRTGNPGIRSRYTSANYMLVEGLIDVHGGGFENYMNPILSDLEMIRSTYKSPYPKRADGNHARGWDGTKVTPIVAYAEKAAASIVSTSTEIAKFVIEVNKSAENPGHNGILSHGMVQKFLGRDNSIYQSSDYPVCSNPSTYGLGINKRASASSWNGNEVYWHTGSHNGYRARMVGVPKKKSGIVILASGQRDNADAFYEELQEAIMNAYGSTYQ